MTSEWIKPDLRWASVEPVGDRLDIPDGGGVEGTVFFGPAAIDRRSCPTVRGVLVCRNYWERGPVARVSCDEGTIYMMPRWGDSWPLTPEPIPYLTLGTTANA